MRSMLLLLALTLPACAGCGSKDKGKTEKASGERESPPHDDFRADAGDQFAQRKPADRVDPVGQPANKPKEKPRRIRTTADMHLIVQDFAEAVKELKAAMKQCDGEEENAEINLSARRRRGVATRPPPTE